jgi:glycosyltransferase involved in cell wall biosynthesis
MLPEESVLASGGSGGSTGPSILVVETQAHVEYGHFPLIFAERAADLIDVGCDVEVLTSRGWALEGDPAFPPLTIHRYGRVARATNRLAEGLRRLRPRAFAQRLGALLSTAVIVLSARRRRRKMQAPAVVLVDFVDPQVASLVAGEGHWLLYQWGPPRLVDGLMSRLFNKWARSAEGRRERHGGRLRVAIATEWMLEPWQQDAPWLAPLVIPFAAARDHDPSISRSVARETLGFPLGDRLALYFGTHPGKDPDVVFRAFSALSEWRLVIAGNGAASAYRAWAARTEVGSGSMPILVDGFVDEATRALLHRAADLLVLSYQPLWLGLDSGGLVDALGWCLPVVCSDRCPASEIVRARGLGTVFLPGDVESLIAAVRAAPASPDAHGVKQARAELSARRATMRLMEALDLS